jgi:hypothetical protein
LGAISALLAERYPGPHRPRASPFDEGECGGGVLILADLLDELTKSKGDLTLKSAGKSARRW